MYMDMDHVMQDLFYIINSRTLVWKVLCSHGTFNFAPLPRRSFLPTPSDIQRLPK